MHYITYHENCRRGTEDFPMEFYHVSPSHPQYSMPIHWHLECEFIRVIEGQLSLTIDEKESSYSKDSIIFIPAGSVHSGSPENNCIYECIVFDMNMLMSRSDRSKKMIHKFINREYELSSYCLNFYDNIHKLIWAMFDTFSEKKTGYELMIQGYLFQFLGEIYEKGIYSESIRHSSRELKRIVQLKHVLEFIENSYANQLTLEDIASSINMSPKYFCRFFQEMTHRTPIDYLNYYRIERACYILLTTDASITDVAYSCGFNDLSYFIKTFKKYKGVTPKKYIK